MKLLRLSIERFAGLSHRTFVFSDGVNVLCGDNETGKSTVIRALEAAFFLPVEIKGTNRLAKQQKEQLQACLPINGGGSCGLELELSYKRQKYLLKKQWGQSPFVSLSCRDAEYIGDDNAGAQLRAMLPFSEATVCSLVFAKQQSFKKTINEIRETGAKDISDFLSRAVLDMGGVSIPVLKEKIIAEYKRLTDNWDMERGLPKNGKGIDNPYRRGNGTIIEYYYARERARREMLVLQEQEEAAARAAAQIKRLTDEITKLEKEEQTFSGLSGNLILRREKEQLLERLLREQERIAAVKKNWIELESNTKALQKYFEQERKTCLALQERMCLWEQAERAEAARSKLSKLSELRREKAVLQTQYRALPAVTKAEIAAWKSYERDILLFETEQCSSKITVHVKTKKDIPVYAEDAQGKHAVQGIAEGQGHLTLLIGDVAAVDITAGENAGADRKISYEVSRRMCRTLAEKWSVPDSAHAQELLTSRNALSEQIEQLEKRYADALGDTTEKELTALANIPSPDGDRREDAQSLEKHKQLLAQTELRLTQAQQSLASYEKEFSVYSAVLLKEQEIKEQIFPLERSLETLKNECPSGFESSEEFIAHVEKVRAAITQKRASLARLKDEQNLYTADMTAKEAAETAQKNDEYFIRDVARAVSLEKIMRAVNHTLHSIHAHVYQGLTEHFQTYLSELTQGRYKTSELNHSLEFTLTCGNHEVPPALLSAGTADALALAFRFAMLDDMMGKDGVCVLDDCLVDLDAQRRECAVQLIRRYAGKHQVIFATCSPENARLLGGNLIQMQERIG